MLLGFAADEAELACPYMGTAADDASSAPSHFRAAADNASHAPGDVRGGRCRVRGGRPQPLGGLWRPDCRGSNKEHAAAPQSHHGAATRAFPHSADLGTARFVKMSTTAHGQLCPVWRPLKFGFLQVM